MATRDSLAEYADVNPSSGKQKFLNFVQRQQRIAVPWLNVAAVPYVRDHDIIPTCALPNGLVRSNNSNCTPNPISRAVGTNLTQ